MTDKELLGLLLFYLGNKYQQTYHKLLTAQFTNNTLIIEHTLQNLDKKEFKEYMKNLGIWLGQNTQFENITVQKVEFQDNTILVHLS